MDNMIRTHINKGIVFEDPTSLYSYMHDDQSMFTYLTALYLYMHLE